MSNTISASITAHHTSPDRVCRARAYTYLAGLIGTRSETVTWDSTHRLQGHVHLGSCKLVVIAPRDDEHQPIVMTEPSWDAVRRSAPGQRRELIEAWAIADHAGLESVLGPEELALCPPMGGLAA
jgi:hypothetical protein